MAEPGEVVAPSPLPSASIGGRLHRPPRKYMRTPQALRGKFDGRRGVPPFSLCSSGRDLTRVGPQDEDDALYGGGEGAGAAAGGGIGMGGAGDAAFDMGGEAGGEGGGDEGGGDEGAGDDDDDEDIDVIIDQDDGGGGRGAWGGAPMVASPSNFPLSPPLPLPSPLSPLPSPTSPLYTLPPLTLPLSR